MKAIAAMAILIALTGCARNVDYVKENASSLAQELRLEVTGYEGFQWSLFAGGKVFYQMKRIPDNGILYTGYFIKRPFTDEIHLYNLRAIDAIRP